MNHFAPPAIVKESGEPLPRLLVCFSHLRWNFVFQRPQHLLTRAARLFELHFIEEPIHEDCDAPYLRREHSGDVTVIVPILPHGCVGEAAIAAHRDLMTAHIAGVPFIAWYYTPMALTFTGHLTPALVVYDNMDELSAFRNAPAGLLDAERRLLAAADVVFTGGRSLYEAKKKRHANIHCFPSSIDRAHFGRARERLEEPRDQAGIAGPRIGFFGVVDERMDTDLVRSLAEARPDWQFIVLGPVVKINPDSLPRRPNLHWLGGKSYDELPAYLAHWHAGMMPFALNESTQFISPTKTPEFLAAGVPVVSAPIRDVVSTYGACGLVEIAGSGPEFVEALSRVLSRAEAQQRAWLTKVDQLLATNSWDLTWQDMHRLMCAASRRDGTTGTPAGRSTSTDGSAHV